MNRKIIVTGGCGYIGSHVARAFKQHGDHVTVIDRVIRDHTLIGIDDYLIADFASTEALYKLSKSDADVIVHCAGTSLVGPSMENPSEYYNNNIVKTIAMLNSIKEMRKKPVILFSSSASVYGVPKSWPLTEDEPVKPISPYGSTKAMTEKILSDYNRAYDIHSMCFRYFNAAGAEPFTFDLGQELDATHIIAKALTASINKRAFTINGGDYNTIDGTCIRDYVHVWDLARAHVMGVSYLLDDYPQPGAYVLNLGTNSGISNKEIVDFVVEKYGIPFVKFSERRPGDPDVLIADASMAREMLGWEPKYSDIGTIIDSAYKWYTR